MQPKLYPRLALALFTGLNILNFIDRNVLLAVQPLVSDAKRAIEELAEAERRLLFTRDEILDHAWRLGKTLTALKQEVGVECLCRDGAVRTSPR